VVLTAWGPISCASERRTLGSATLQIYTWTVPPFKFLLDVRGTPMSGHYGIIRRKRLRLAALAAAGTRGVQPIGERLRLIPTEGTWRDATQDKLNFYQ
jgi:hypothetical protein